MTEQKSNTCSLGRRITKVYHHHSMGRTWRMCRRFASRTIIGIAIAAFVILVIAALFIAPQYFIIGAMIALISNGVSCK